MTRPSLHDDQGDALARLAASTRADSFGPYFADRVMERVHAERGDRAVGRRAIVLPWRLAASLAAAAVVLAISAGSWWLLHTRVITAGSAAVVASLPDGTTVTVAPGSSLRHAAFALRAHRAVTLAGEAFFEVATAEAPFVVETHDARITVTGTRFNVRSWASAIERSTEVALVEGSVLLASRTGSGGALSLQQGQTGRVETAGPALVTTAPDPENASAWRSGGMSYSDRPLADVLHDLERRFGVRIDAEASVMDGRTVTYLNPRDARLEDVLDALAFALDVRLVRTAQGWRIVEPTMEMP